MAYECVSIRVPVSMRYGSSETNYQYGHRHKCIYGCLLTVYIYRCKLLIHVVSKGACEQRRGWGGGGGKLGRERIMTPHCHH